MRYNFKDEENLQITDFCCEGCLGEDIVEGITHLRKYETLEVYAKAWLVEELIGLLHGLVIDDIPIQFGMLNFDGQGDDYDDVYCLSIDDTYSLSCVPAYNFNENTREYNLYDSESTLAYVYQEDCKQDLIDKLEKNGVPTLLFGIEAE